MEIVFLFYEEGLPVAYMEDKYLSKNRFVHRQPFNSQDIFAQRALGSYPLNICSGAEISPGQAQNELRFSAYGAYEHFIRLPPW
jgi:hypothetical protein